MTDYYDTGITGHNLYNSKNETQVLLEYILDAEAKLINIDVYFKPRWDITSPEAFSKKTKTKESGYDIGNLFILEDATGVNRFKHDGKCVIQDITVEFKDVTANDIKPIGACTKTPAEIAAAILLANSTTIPRTANTALAIRVKKDRKFTAMIENLETLKNALGSKTSPIAFSNKPIGATSVDLNLDDSDNLTITHGELKALLHEIIMEALTR